MLAGGRQQIIQAQNPVIIRVYIFFFPYVGYVGGFPDPSHFFVPTVHADTQTPLFGFSVRAANIANISPNPLRCSRFDPPTQLPTHANTSAPLGQTPSSAVNLTRQHKPTQPDPLQP